MRAEPDTGAFSKQGGELLQRNFTITETDPVANTQRRPAHAYPAIVTMQKYAIAGIGVCNPYTTVFAQLQAGVPARSRAVIEGEIT